MNEANEEERKQNCVQISHCTQIQWDWEQMAVGSQDNRKKKSLFFIQPFIVTSVSILMHDDK